MMKQLKVGLILLAAAVMLVSGCKTASVKSPETIVLERAQARWDAIYKKNYKKAYEYLSMGFRELYSPAAYERRIERQPVKWLATKVEKAECESEICKVHIKLLIKVKPRVPGVPEVEVETALAENWLKDQENGKWYHVPKK